MQDSEHEANSPVSAATREAMKKRQFHEDGAEQKVRFGRGLYILYVWLDGWAIKYYGAVHQLV